MGRQEQEVAFILNANVVIDYADADPVVLALISKHLGVGGLPAPLLDEVDQLGDDDCARLGIRLVEPDFAQLAEAARGRTALSFEDRLCFILARDMGATCITNDKRLRTECARQDVPLLWGLEVMVRLVKEKALTKKAALTIAETIRENNPLHITADVLRRFRKRLSSR